MDLWNGAVVMVDEHAVPDHGGHVSVAVLERAAAMFKAAGSPERLRLLECLRAGEACVTGLAEHLGLCDQSPSFLCPKQGPRPLGDGKR